MCSVANSHCMVIQVITVEDYNEYCHYVAGIVGLGLSRLFHASGLEDAQPDDLSNSMGLFLQVRTSAWNFRFQLVLYKWILLCSL